MNELITDVQHEFRRHRQLAERAIAQLDDEAFFRRPSGPQGAGQSNPVALIVKHLAGNLRSRWTDFLTSDGEKTGEGGQGGQGGRNRDDEFVLGPGDSRPHLMAQWDAGWGALQGTLASLNQSNLTQTITIRGEAHTVQQALLRGLTHAAYHTGQILYLARLLKPDSEWLTIAPGKSASHRAAYRRDR